MELIARHLRPEIKEALGWSRVVMIHGARQTGKTTLAREPARPRAPKSTSPTLD